MKKTILVSLLFTYILILSGCAAKDKEVSATSVPSPSAQAVTDSPMTSSVQKADKIEVVHFHGTNQCYSCITVGKYTLKTIQERFSKEYKKGTIVFRDINVELPENTDMAIKYQARGTSLFVNAIANGQDQIEEDVKVWRLISDEQAFMDYFEGRLKELLG